MLPVVKQVEKELASSLQLNHEYLDIDGLASLTRAAQLLLLGKCSFEVFVGSLVCSPLLFSGCLLRDAIGSERAHALQERVYSAQTLSGTGALSLGASLLAKRLGATHVPGSRRDRTGTLMWRSARWISAGCSTIFDRRRSMP